MVRLLAYDISDREYRGEVRLTAERLTDMLTEADGLEVTALLIRDLRAGRVSSWTHGTLRTDDLAIVVATGPQGSWTQRIPVASYAVQMTVHRYLVHGLLHAPITRDPIAHARGRDWLPVTEAVLEQHGAGRVIRERFETLVVNRAYVRSVVKETPSAHTTRWVAARTSEMATLR